MKRKAHIFLVTPDLNILKKDEITVIKVRTQITIESPFSFVVVGSIPPEVSVNFVVVKFSCGTILHSDFSRTTCVKIDLDECLKHNKNFESIQFKNISSRLLGSPKHYLIIDHGTMPTYIQSEFSQFRTNKFQFSHRRGKFQAAFSGLSIIHFTWILDPYQNQEEGTYKQVCPRFYGLQQV